MTAVAVVLAAGKSTRFGSDKLGALLDGRPLLYHAIAAARAAPVDRVIVVARAGTEVGEWPGSPPVETMRIASEALSASLQAGVAAATAAGAKAAYIFLGDMPAIPHDLAGKLAAAIGDAVAAIPCHDGAQGHPVLLTPAMFPQVAALTGDHGAGRLLRGRNDVARLACADPGIRYDVDRADDLRRQQPR